MARLPSSVSQQAKRNRAIVALARRELAKLWPRVNWSSPAAPQAVSTIYEAIVTRYGEIAATVGAEFYDEVRAEQQPRTQYRATVADPVDEERVNGIVESAFRGYTVAADQADGSHVTTSELPVEDRVQQRLEQSLSRLVLQPGRGTIAENVRKDPAQPVWVRVPTGETTCEFCIMLASREFGTHFSGYRSERVALFDDNGDKYHKNCDCVAVPIFDGLISDVSPNIGDYQRIYYKATRAAGTHSDTKAILREMRKIIAAEQPTPAPKPRPTPKPEPSVRLPVVVDLDTPTPNSLLRPHDDPLPDIRVKQDLTRDLAADLAATNPKFRDGEQWQINCTRCAAAVELRARGYDVTAEPKPSSTTDNDPKSILERWRSPDGSLAGQDAGLRATRDPNPGEAIGMSSGSRIWHWLPAGRKAGKAAADAAVTEWGDGARGYITVVWSGRRSAHIFNVENHGGRIIYTDGQSNEIDASSHWDRISTAAETARIVRTDDLTPTRRVMEWVRERSDTEVNAPSEQAIGAELARRGLRGISSDARAFRAGVKAVLDGEEPDSKYSTFQATQQNYDAGVEWARTFTAARSDASTAPVSAAAEAIDGPRRGSVDRSNVKHVIQHELDTAQRLADLGDKVVFLPAAKDAGRKNPDVMINDEQWELKSPESTKPNTILRRLTRGRQQSPRMVLDLARTDIPIEQAIDIARQALARYPEIESIRVIGRVTAVGEPLDITLNREVSEP